MIMRHRKAILALVLAAVTVLICAPRPGGAEREDKAETRAFYKGKNLCIKGKHDSARIALQQYIKDYPSGRLVDEALFWLAQTTNDLSNEEEAVERVLSLKKEAVGTLTRLIEAYPGSVWLNDARELRVEIAAALAVLGQTSYLRLVEDAAAHGGSELKLSAAGILVSINPRLAVIVVQNILKTDTDPRLRKRAVKLLGQDSRPESMALLEEISKGDRDAEIRAEASSLLKKMRAPRVGLTLSCTFFAARLTGSLRSISIPENQLTLMAFPKKRWKTDSELIAELDSFFEGRLSRILLYGIYHIIPGFKDLVEPRGLDAWIYHKRNGFRIGFSEATWQGSVGTDERAGSVAAKIVFRDVPTDRTYVGDLFFAGESDQLAVMRRDDELAIAYVTALRPPDQKPLTRKSSVRLPSQDSKQTENKTYSTIARSLECRIESSQTSWTDRDYQTAVVAYGQARVTIPGLGGDWTLTGDITLDRSRRCFIARQARLLPPQGAGVEADEISVPAEHQKYAANLPIKVEPDKVIADREYRGTGLRVVMTCPNPMNRTTGMIIYTAQQAEDLLGIREVAPWDEEYAVARGSNVLGRGFYKRNGSQWTF